MNGQERSFEQTDGITNLSQPWFGSFDVEKAMASDPSVAEVVVVPMTLHLDGQALSAFITLREGVAESEELKTALTRRVEEEIGLIGIPESSTSRPACPGHDQARSCAIFSKRWLRTNFAPEELAAAGQTGRAAIQLLLARQNHPIMKGTL